MPSRQEPEIGHASGYGEASSWQSFLVGLGAGDMWTRVAKGSGWTL